MWDRGCRFVDPGNKASIRKSAEFAGADLDGSSRIDEKCEDSVRKLNTFGRGTDA